MPDRLIEAGGPLWEPFGDWTAEMRSTLIFPG
jgi:hypothetical protein